MPLEPLFRPLLSSLSPAWALTNAVARRFKAKKAVHFPVPVFSIGNIVAGGVGKTEIVALVARRLVSQGKHVAIAARGYGSPWEKSGGIARSFSEALALSFPDEALVLLKKLEGFGPGSVAVCVGADRAGLLERHWTELQPDIVLLDDGFQHFKIARNLDILIHDFSVPWPVLREFPSVLNNVQLRVSFSEIPKIWQKKPWVRVRYSVKGCITAQAALKPMPLRALAFCGLGNPERFRRSLKSAGVQLAGFRKFADHKAYGPGELGSLRNWQKSKGGLPILTTLKDYVKWIPLLETAGDFDLRYVDIEVDFMEGEKDFWKIIAESSGGANT